LRRAAGAKAGIAMFFEVYGMVIMYVTTAAAFFASCAAIPLLLVFCDRNRWYDAVSLRKVHDGNVPRLGSLGFVPVFFAASSAALFLIGGEKALLRALPVFIPAFVMFVFGIIDDFKTLRARVKFAMQCCAALVPVVCGLYIRQIGPLQMGSFGAVVTFFYLLGFINAFNLIDGIDALCAGLSLGVSLSLGVLYALARLNAQAAVMFILASVLASFLMYNKPRAKIFMGDGGSQFLGFLLASFPLLPSAPHIEYNKLLLMLTLASIPALDTISAIWRRTRDGKLFFFPDTKHIHHKFLNMGYTIKSILFFLLLIQFGLCVLGVTAVHFIGYFRGMFVLGAGFAAVCMFFGIIHYTHLAVSRVKHELNMDEKLSAYSENFTETSRNAREKARGRYPRRAAEKNHASL
jgi:UDP-GlcNAc:undecaprenyl-phosphate GlcNAc-1-phosphate transferase